MIIDARHCFATLSVTLGDENCLKYRPRPRHRPHLSAKQPMTRFFFTSKSKQSSSCFSKALARQSLSPSSCSTLGSSPPHCSLPGSLPDCATAAALQWLRSHQTCDGRRRCPNAFSTVSRPKKWREMKAIPTQTDDSAHLCADF